jgi:hypothetical protein
MPLSLAPRPAVGVPDSTVLELPLIVAVRYAFHPDELYFLEPGQHLALGLVDQRRSRHARSGFSSRKPEVTPIIACGTLARGRRELAQLRRGTGGTNATSREHSGGSPGSPIRWLIAVSRFAA